MCGSSLKRHFLTFFLELKRLHVHSNVDQLPSTKKNAIYFVVGFVCTTQFSVCVIIGPKLLINGQKKIMYFFLYRSNGNVSTFEIHKIIINPIGFFFKSWLSFECTAPFKIGIVPYSSVKSQLFSDTNSRRLIHSELFK